MVDLQNVDGVYVGNRHSQVHQSCLSLGLVVKEDGVCFSNLMRFQILNNHHIVKMHLSFRVMGNQLMISWSGV